MYYNCIIQDFLTKHLTHWSNIFFFQILLSLTLTKIKWNYLGMPHKCIHVHKTKTHEHTPADPPLATHPSRQFWQPMEVRLKQTQEDPCLSIFFLICKLLWLPFGIKQKGGAVMICVCLSVFFTHTHTHTHTHTYTHVCVCVHLCACTLHSRIPACKARTKYKDKKS